VRFNLRTKTGRAVVREGNSIDDKLGLVLRAARMEHGVAFIKPARLGIHQILYRAAWNGAKPCLNLIRSDLADGAWTLRVDQRRRGSYIYGFGHPGKLELDGALSFD